MVVAPIIARDDMKPLRSNFLSCCGVVPGDQAVHPAHISASIVMINSTDIEERSRWRGRQEETRFEQTARKIVICIDRLRDKARERGRSRGSAREREDSERWRDPQNTV